MPTARNRFGWGVACVTRDTAGVEGGSSPPAALPELIFVETEIMP